MPTDDAPVSRTAGRRESRERPADRRSARRAGWIIAGVSAVIVWSALLAWSAVVLDGMGARATDRFDAAFARFDDRRSAAGLALESMGEEVILAEDALVRSDGLVQDPESRARLEEAHADGAREIDRLRGVLADQVEQAEASRPLVPASIWPNVWHVAADRIESLVPPSDADFQAESAAMLMAANAVDRSMADWEVAHAAELEAAFAVRVEADATVGRGLPDGRKTDGYDAVVVVTAEGGDVELGRCEGAVDLRDLLPASAVIGALWECGGSEFPRWPGAIVRLSGLGFGGEYRVDGTAAYLDVARWDPADLPSGHHLLFETSVPETGEFVYVGLTLIRPLPDLPGPIT